MGQSGRHRFDSACQEMEEALRLSCSSLVSGNRREYDEVCWEKHARGEREGGARGGLSEMNHRLADPRGYSKVLRKERARVGRASLR